MGYQDTSREAFEHFNRSGRAKTVREQVHQYIRQQQKKGLTCYEIVVTTGMLHPTVSSAITRLVEDGCVVDSGNRRLTGSGRKARVLIDSIYAQGFPKNEVPGV